MNYRYLTFTLVFSLFSVLVFIFPLPAIAKEVKIFGIYNQFTAVSAASGKCIKPSSDELTAFLVNYQMVTVLMIQEIKKRKPNWTEKQVNDFIEQGANKITSKIHELIQSSGCDAPMIKDLIKRFNAQAKWKP